MAKFQKYKNPDERCRYPFTPDPIGYCWTFANVVDGTWNLDRLKACLSCSMWQDPNDGPVGHIPNY